MKTIFVPETKWRQNLITLWRKAENKNIRYIVTRYSKPMYIVKPLFEEKFEI